MFTACVLIKQRQYYHFGSKLQIRNLLTTKSVRLKRLPFEDKSSASKKSKFKNSLIPVFGKYLLVTNTLSSGILMALGDLLQQEIEHVVNGTHANSFDWKRNSKSYFMKI